MIINGFGGGSDWSGTETLLATQTGTYTFTTGRSSMSLYDSSGSWKSLLDSDSTVVTWPATVTVNLSSYFDYGYKALKVVPSITSVSSGNIATYQNNTTYYYTNNAQVKFGIGYYYSVITSYPSSSVYSTLEEDEYIDITTSTYKNQKQLRDIMTFTSSSFLFTTKSKVVTYTNIPKTGYTTNSGNSIWLYYIHQAKINGKNFYSPFITGYGSSPMVQKDYLSFIDTLHVGFSYFIKFSGGQQIRNSDSSTSSYTGGNVQVITTNESAYGSNPTKPTISYSIKIYGCN